MIFRVETEEQKRARQSVPHRTFMGATKLVGDHGDLWVVCRFVWRRWDQGWLFNIGDGKWRRAFESFY